MGDQHLLMRKTRGVTTIAVAALLFAPVTSLAQQSLDLQSALSAAQASNLELRAARQQRALALAGLTTARQLPNPVISFTAARDTPHEGVSVELPIELGGQRGKRIAVAREEQKSAEIDVSILGRQIRRRGIRLTRAPGNLSGIFLQTRIRQRPPSTALAETPGRRRLCS